MKRWQRKLSWEIIYEGIHKYTIELDDGLYNLYYGFNPDYQFIGESNTLQMAKDLAIVHHSRIILEAAND